MVKQREGNYDLLRVLCTIAVVCTHVVAKYKTAITSPSPFGVLYTDNLFITCLYDTLAWFAVPCFVMLSGAFCINDSRNSDYQTFYRKSLIKIGMPTVIFTAFYFCYSFARMVYDVLVYDISAKNLLTPLKALWRGEPFYHLWYLFMLIGLYVAVPILVRIRETLGKKTFRTVTWGVFVWCMLSMYNSTHTLYWDIGLAACYLGYFMLGAVLREGAEKKSNGKGLLLIGIGVLVLLAAALYEYNVYLYTVTDGVEGIVKDFSYKPFNTVASVFLFSGFSYLDLRSGKATAFLSKYSFVTYLIHAFVWDILFRVVRRFLPWNNVVALPLLIALTFLLSLAAAIVYTRLWNWIRQKRIKQ